MDISLEPNSSLNKANFYERKSEKALCNLSKLIGLVEKNYADAIEFLQKAISYLDQAKADICSGSEEELRIYEMRQASLQRQFETLQPYRFLLIHRPTADAKSTRSRSLDSRLRKSTEGFVFLVDENGNNPLRDLTPYEAKPTVVLKNYSKPSDQRLEECEVRMAELEKMVNELSLKLEESERRAALEENARLAAEGELLMIRRPHHWGCSPLETNSVYNSVSIDTCNRSYTPDDTAPH
uniref:MIT domain-containing protein n=1 Tax=Mesocestoides corti TaxID=53468 RepID=A0A5K3EM15_MESCO